MNAPLIRIEGRRANTEWIADHPDQAIPKAVKLRIIDRCKGLCGLTGKKLRAGEFDFDHIVRLRDGGEHREANLHVVWRQAHRDKTAVENSEGAHVDRVRLKHLGLWPKSKRPIQSRGFEKRNRA